MSLQKGNAQRTRAQKHKNTHAFKNTLHDTSKKTQHLNQLDVHGVCLRCKDIIEWKIKYKKYKPLTAPKKCTKCQERAIVASYRTVCKNCASASNVCEKCGESKEIVQRTRLTPQEQMKQDAEFEKELKGLPERRRRTLLRYLAKQRDNPENDQKLVSAEFREKIEKVKQKLPDDEFDDDDCDEFSSGDDSNDAESGSDE